MEPFEGRLDGKGTATNQIRIRLDADAGDVIVGGNGRGGDLKLTNDANVTKIRLDAGGVEAPVLETPPTESILLSGDTGTISLMRGGLGTRVSGVSLGASGDMLVGRKDENDSILLKTKDGKQRIHLDADGGNIWLGGNNVNGDLLLFPGTNTDINDTSQATVWLNGETGSLVLRRLNEGKYKSRIHLESEKGKIMLGGNGEPGDLLLFNDEGDNKTIDQATIWIQGKTGDIILKNADCAEDFDVSEREKIEPGTVMVLAREGKLEQSSGAYDKKVAGVISGAGEYQPGIVLDKKQSENQRLPVALIGKVYCKVDAEYSSIEVGDLLTTSPTPGHAMKASDPLRAFGAVIGKALRPLAAGQGLIPMLIALQ
jgi:hypothetical protein